MREVTSKVYTFDELSDRAKDTARQWYREIASSDFAADLEDAAHMADIIGINLRARPVKLMGGSTRQDPDIYWVVDSRDAGASFSGSYSYRKGSVAAMAKEAPTGDDKTHKGNNELNRIASTLADVQKRNFYQIQASIGHGRSPCTNISVDVERKDGKEMSDDDIETTRAALQDFASWIHRQLESEYEYQNADEQVDETIRANEYEFDEDGNRA